MSQKINLDQVFKKFLETECLENKKILLMVSGGIDSMVLLDVCLKIIDKNNLAVFHLDHNLRENSQEDFNFVEDIGSELGIKFYGEILEHNTAKFSLNLKRRDKKNNLENSWRNSRKKLSQKSAKKFGAQKILTAHHATDLVETMIFRLTKGCSVNGLSPFDISTKPFWKISKAEIIKYAEENNLKWVEDSSNENLDFERNLIRKKVLPELRKINPNLEKVFVRESLIFTETQEYLDLGVDNMINNAPQSPLNLRGEDKGNKKNILLEEFLNFPCILQKEFLQKISGTICSFSEIQDCLKWLLNNPKGNSQKKLGKNVLRFKNKNIDWK